MAKYIFITGGVVSSLGKGVAAASLGALLQARGYKICLRKLDPYLNVDPGTMSPYQHGEVFVTDDGAETDLDLGHYERFTDISVTKNDSITTGRIYRNIIECERRGDYLGGTVQVIPHVTDEIKHFIVHNGAEYDFIICEIGGTVGDIEAMPFLEAIRQLRNDLAINSTVYVHLTLVPYLAAAGELKTKPTQHSVKELQSLGITPDILVVRADRPIPESECRKLSLFCNVCPECVIQALEVSNIYSIPLSFHEQGLDKQVLKSLAISNAPEADLQIWQTIDDKVKNLEKSIKITIVGKYINLKDAYKSLIEALTHAGIVNNAVINIEWVATEELEASLDCAILKDSYAILIPGAFGSRGAEAKIKAIEFARKNKIPFLGICFGMQLACIEAARNLCGIKGASSTEFGVCDEPVVSIMKGWLKGEQLEKRSTTDDLGGTMRLGSYEATLKPGSIIEKIYGASSIFERHRHRFEVNIKYQDLLEAKGLVISGLSPDGILPEAVEYIDHPWFVAVQYHPELKSRPFAPHPLFVSFVEAALRHKEG